MGEDSSEPKDSDISQFELPPELAYHDRGGDTPHKAEGFGIDLDVDPNRWTQWVVKLQFKKLGAEKHGNGFYVNIPTADFDVILTAGHNLVDKPQHYCTDIRIVRTDGETPVTEDMIHVCQRYYDDPNELNAIYDYGIIKVKRDAKRRAGLGFGFGFNFMFGFGATSHEEQDVLQDTLLYVSGYRPETPLQEGPRRSEGKCIRTKPHQLEYKAEAVQGMSGGPVWLGFRGYETVVAIHNYGASTEDDGNRGSRLSLRVWDTIFGWLNLGWYGKSLYYKGHPTYSMHLHLPPLAPSVKIINHEARVRVGKPGKLETFFDILPVASSPNAKYLDASFGFILRPESSDPQAAATPIARTSTDCVWVSWDPKRGRVTTVDKFGSLCEVKLLHVVGTPPGKPFMIRVQDANGFKQVKMSMSLLEEDDLQLLGSDPQSFEDTFEVSLMNIKNEKLFEFR